MAFNVGVYPNSVSVDDLNGDGKLDFAVAINNTGKVSVSIGSGNGTFGAPSSFGAGSIPRSVRIGDLNADGNRDLVTANNGSTTVSVLLGTGSGNFGTHTQFDVGASPTSVAVADLDGNGTPDLLTANNSSQPGTVSVILGTGAGSFGTPSLSSVELEPSMVAVGEFNGDGMADVVAANSWSDTVSVLLGTGNGSLGAQSAIACGLYPSSVAIGDLSGDGIHDLVTTNGSMYSVGPDTVSVLVGSGLGTFGAPIAFGVNGSPVSVAIADVNADGRRDLITANYASNDFSVLLNSMALPGTAGVSVFGTGTSGCEGTIGLNANSIPNLGNVNFAIVGSNAPHDSVGLTLVTDVQDLQGSDLFYVNIVIHVGVAGATEVFTLDVISGPAGEQFAAVPIPNNPGLVGKTYFLQSYWIEPLDNRCTSGAAGLESSRGLSITIQP
jgi:hypothetical protein